MESHQSPKLFIMFITYIFYLSLDVVSSKDWLLQFNILEGDEWEGERLHGVLLLLVVEDHPVRGQVESPLLLSSELRTLLTIDDQKK